jgi:hypothetical protein
MSIFDNPELLGMLSNLKAKQDADQPTILDQPELSTGGMMGNPGYSLAAPEYHKQSLDLGTGQSTYTNRWTGQEEGGYGMSRDAGILWTGDEGGDTAENRQSFVDATNDKVFKAENGNWLGSDHQWKDMRDADRSPNVGTNLEVTPLAEEAPAAVANGFNPDPNNPVFSPLGDKTQDQRMRFFTNVAQNQYRAGNTTSDQNEQMFSAMLDPNHEWKFRDAQVTRLNNDVTRVARDNEKSIHDAIGDNKTVRTESIDNWYAQVNEMGPNEQYLYFKNNPEWALRHNALAAKLGDKTPEENKRFAATLSQDLGIPYDGAGTKDAEHIQGKNGRYLVTDFSGRVDNDITKPYSPQDLLAVGTYQAPDERSGLSKGVQALGNALSPFTMGLSPLVASGLRAAGGETLHTGDYIETGISAAGGYLGGTGKMGFPDSLMSTTTLPDGTIVNMTAGGQIIPNELAKQVGMMEAVGNAGAIGVPAVGGYNQIEGQDPNNPMKGYGDQQGPGGLYDLMVKENPMGGTDPVEDTSGGGGSDSSNAGADSSQAGGEPSSGDNSVANAPVEGDVVGPNVLPQDASNEVWRHTNPDGSVVAGNEVGDVWQVEGTPPSEAPPTDDLPDGYQWVIGENGEWELEHDTSTDEGDWGDNYGDLFGDSIGDSTDGLGDGTGTNDSTGDTGDGDNTTGDVDDGLDDGTGDQGTGDQGTGDNGTGDDGTGDGDGGEGDGDGDLDGEGEGSGAGGQGAVSDTEWSELFPYTKITPLLKKKLFPHINYIRSIKK